MQMCTSCSVSGCHSQCAHRLWSFECYTDPFCTHCVHWKQKVLNVTSLVMDLQTAYAQIACMQKSEGLSSSSLLPSCVDRIWPQLFNLIKISCSLFRPSYGHMLACKHITSCWTTLNLALLLVWSAQIDPLGRPFQQVLPNWDLALQTCVCIVL